MKILRFIVLTLLITAITFLQSYSQTNEITREVEQGMLRATRFMVEKVSTNGGYVWFYLPDFTRRWGEMEAYNSMIWVQSPGTVSMGHLFLDAYRVTGEEYYYQAKESGEDYPSYYTFNDGVIAENVEFLIQCYLLLGQERLLEPIRKGMDFYVISQDTSGGWGQQLNMKMEAAGARSYEPKALLPSTTLGNAMTLLTYYQYTGDKKFLERIPDVIKWLERVKLPASQTEGGRYTHSTFVEIGTNKPIYVHRKGSNVIYGKYYHDYNDSKLLAHYGGKNRISVERLSDPSDQDYISTSEYIKNMTLLISYIKSVRQ